MFISNIWCSMKLCFLTMTYSLHHKTLSHKIHFKHNVVLSLALCITPHFVEQAQPKEQVQYAEQTHTISHINTTNHITLQMLFSQTEPTGLNQVLLPEQTYEPSNIPNNSQIFTSTTTHNDITS